MLRRAPQMVWLADITDETTPQIISNYIVDRANTGMHILKPSGKPAAISGPIAQ